MAEQRATLPRGENVLQSLQDPAVVATAVGVLAGTLLVQGAYRTQRSIFGYSTKSPTTGQPVFVNVDPATGFPPADKTQWKNVNNAYLNRILLNAGLILAGAVLMDRSENVNLDYLGLGIAAHSAGNLALSVLGIYPCWP